MFAKNVFVSHLGGILGRYNKRKAPPGEPAELTRGVGGLQICKNWQELSRIAMVSITAAPRKAGGAGSTCASGQPRHRAWG